MRSRIKARRPLSAPASDTTPDTVFQATPNSFNPHDAASSRAGKRQASKRGSHKREAQAACGECADCLWQAEICCEQARAAARLKRLEAACGLFATAQSLLKRVIASSGDACAELCDDAREKLKNITSEMATYGDLAKSCGRPMRIHATAFATGISPASERSSPPQIHVNSDGLAP